MQNSQSLRVATQVNPQQEWSFFLWAEQGRNDDVTTCQRLIIMSLILNYIWIIFVIIILYLKNVLIYTYKFIDLSFHVIAFIYALIHLSMHSCNHSSMHPLIHPSIHYLRQLFPFSSRLIYCPRMKKMKIIEILMTLKLHLNIVQIKKIICIKYI